MFSSPQHSVCVSRTKQAVKENLSTSLVHLIFSQRSQLRCNRIDLANQRLLNTQQEISNSRTRRLVLMSLQHKTRHSSIGKGASSPDTAAHFLNCARASGGTPKKNVYLAVGAPESVFEWAAAGFLQFFAVSTGATHQINPTHITFIET